MAISSIAGSSISHSFRGQATQQSPQTIADPVAKALKPANNRIEQQLGSTKVQLSAYGQIKGAFAEVQAASKALSDTKKTTTGDDVKKGVESFVNAFNKANKAVGTAVRGDAKQVGTLANDPRARIAGNDLRHAVAEGSTLSDLKQIGITQNQDGSLAIDTQAFDTALQANPDQVRSTAASVGQQVEKTATRELANNGNVGSSVNALNQRSRSLEAQQSAQQDQLVASQRLVEQQTTQINNIFAGGLVAYQRTLTG